MILNDYRIVPVQGGGACVLGTREDGTPWRTTEIRRYRPGEVETASGTRYRLGTQHVSMWGYALLTRRPALHAKFAEAGLV